MKEENMFGKIRGRFDEAAAKKAVKKMSMLVSKDAQHGSTINDLAERGVIEEVSFIAPDGVGRTANSMFTACEWLRENFGADRGVTKWL